jgi:hypothetical protein
MCENVDANVGRVLRRLDELKLASNTIVVYFADNGPNSVRWNGGMKGRKGSTDEGGVRSPLLIRWPGKIPPHTTVRQIAGAIDLLPTLASLANVPLDKQRPLDGLDLTPLLLNKAQDWPDRMIFSHWNGKISVRTQNYRFDDTGNLFDMVADPGQTKNVAQQKLEISTKLAKAVNEWRQDVLTKAVAELPEGKVPAKANAKKGKRPNVPDSRPFTVGYKEFPMTPLPARDGVPHGGVARSGSAPNCSYFVNWTNTSDSMTWDIAVNTAGEYEVDIYYTCPEQDAGSTIELGFQTSKLTAKVTPGWNPPLYTNQDTLPRPPAESKMKEFRPLHLGTMHLESARGLLTLKALTVPGKSVMDVRMITLTLKN